MTGRSANALDFSQLDYIRTRMLEIEHVGVLVPRVGVQEELWDSGVRLQARVVQREDA